MQALAACGWFVWCSYEPGLGPIDMRPALAAGLRWVVIGGESGQKARPFQIEWAESVIAQCRDARVPVFMKQFGAKPMIPDSKEWGLDWPDGTRFGNRTREPKWDGRQVLLDDRKGGVMEFWPEKYRVRELPA
jgi:hypothetical protein